MSWRYSVLEHDEVWVDEYDDDITDCDECGTEVNLTEGEGEVDGDSAFCNSCYDNIFGEDD